MEDLRDEGALDIVLVVVRPRIGRDDNARLVVLELEMSGAGMEGRIEKAKLSYERAVFVGVAGLGGLGGLGGGMWQAPLAGWAATGDLDALQRGFERAALADVVALFTTGDPLSIDVPFAFTIAKQVEARNMRLLSEAAVRGIGTDPVRTELIWPGTRA